MGKMTDEQIMNMKEEDILAKLMGTYEVPEATVFIDRMEIPVTLKGLSEKEISKIRKECTYTRKVKGKIEDKFDGNEFDAGLIIASTTNFDWNNSKLLESAKASDGKQFILRKLLAGERTNLVNKVLDLSGYNDELSDAEDIKNLSGEEEQ